MGKEGIEWGFLADHGRLLVRAEVCAGKSRQGHKQLSNTR